MIRTRLLRALPALALAVAPLACDSKDEKKADTKTEAKKDEKKAEEKKTDEKKEEKEDGGW